MSYGTRESKAKQNSLQMLRRNGKTKDEKEDQKKKTTKAEIGKCSKILK
jgi:hypothetical protein